MKIRCPNINTKEWKALEKDLGKERAYLAYFRHGKGIPDVEVARGLLEKAPEVKETPIFSRKEETPEKEKKVYTREQRLVYNWMNENRVKVHKNEYSPYFVDIRVPNIEQSTEKTFNSLLRNTNPIEYYDEINKLEVAEKAYPLRVRFSSPVLKIESSFDINSPESLNSGAVEAFKKIEEKRINKITKGEINLYSFDEEDQIVLNDLKKSIDPIVDQLDKQDKEYVLKNGSESETFRYLKIAARLKRKGIAIDAVIVKKAQDWQNKINNKEEAIKESRKEIKYQIHVLDSDIIPGYWLSTSDMYNYSFDGKKWTSPKGEEVSSDEVFNAAHGVYKHSRDISSFAGEIADAFIPKGEIEDLIVDVEKTQEKKDTQKALRELGIEKSDYDSGYDTTGETPTFSRKQEPADIFFSPTLRAVESLKQEKGTGDQMFAMITKAPGVKEAEWKWMGLDDFLKGKQSVTKQEIEDFARQNQVEIKEVGKGTRKGVSGKFDVKEKNGGYIGIDKETGKEITPHFETKGEVKIYFDNYGDRYPETEDNTKFKQYTLPGGLNYREVLLTLPSTLTKFAENKWMTTRFKSEDEARKYYDDFNKTPGAFDSDVDYGSIRYEDGYIKTKDNLPKYEYKSSHWSESNVIAHIRMDDRTGPDGEKVLFVEEIQSDWAREAREKGVQGGLPQGWKISSEGGEYVVRDEIGKDRGSGPTEEEAMKVVDWHSGAVSNSPFLKNWEELTLKRVLRMAAEEGYDRVAWINGDQTAARYDLSKQISKVIYQPENKLLLAYNSDAGEVIREKNVPPEKIADYIGKEPAKRLLEAPVTGTGDNIGGMKEQMVKGVDLKIGGAWAKSLYDVIIPKFYEKYGKKWGTKVENIPLDMSGMTSEDVGSGRKALVEEAKNGGWAVRFDDGETHDYYPDKVLAQAEADRLNKGAFENISEQQSIKITPEMRESVLTEGQPMFSRKQESGPAPETEMPKEQNLIDVYAQATENPAEMAKKLRGDTRKYREYTDRIAADVFVPLSTRLNKIGSSFKQAMRKFEFRVGRQETTDSRKIRPLLDATKKMSVKDRIVFDLALKNEDTTKVKELVVKYKIEKEFDKAREMLNDIHRRAVEAGFDINFVEDYWPRSVLNPAGLIEELTKLPEWGIIEEQIRKEEQTLKRLLTDSEKSKLANQFMARPDRLLQAPGHLKERTMDLIDNDMDKYYDDSMSAIVKYTHEMNMAIETRKFFNFKKDDVDAVALDLFFGEPHPSTRITDIDGGIGRYVMEAIQSERMKPEQQDELIGLLKARFNYRPSGSIVQKIKELGYITSMGSGFSSFITQIGDLSWAYYVAGPIKATVSTVKAFIGKSELTKENLGLERVAEEFRTGRGFGKALQKIFDITLLSKMDNIGKEALINGSLARFRSQAKSGNKEFVAQVNDIFGEEADQVIMDLKNKENSENVKYLLFNKLLDFQPMTLSEMPLKYLTSPNGRLLYMLKTFTIKQIDAFRNECVSVIADGVKNKDNAKIAKGLKNLMYLTALFVMANAGADAIKDWLFGRIPAFQDKVWDNILRLVGLSRFIVWEARRSGPVKAFWKLVSPPMDIVEAPLKDFWTLSKDDDKSIGIKIKNAETWKIVPFLGKHYYWWFGGGRESELNKQDRNSPYAKLKREIRVQRAKAKRIGKRGAKDEKKATKEGDKAQAERINRETKDKIKVVETDLKKYVEENKEAAAEYRRKQMEALKKKMEEEL